MSRARAFAGAAGRSERRLRRLLTQAQLLHPLPVALTVAAGAGFAWLAARGEPGPGALALFLGSLTLTQGAISVHNDLCDRHLDAVAKPWRPLPSGAIDQAAARRLGLALLAGGGALAALQGPIVLLLATIGTGAGLVYNAWLKRTGWSWLPFVVGFPTLVLWAFAAMGRLEAPLLAAYLVGAPLVVAVHLADAVPDLASDSAAGVDGLAHRLGPTGASVGSLAGLLVGAAAVAVLRPADMPPGALFAAGLLATATAAAAWWRGMERAHWLAVMLAAVGLALDWLRVLAHVGLD